MKNKLLKSIMLSTLISTVGVGTVFAATTDTDYENQSTNVSDYSIKMIINNKQDVGSSSYLEMSGIKSSNITDNYFVKLVEKNTPKPAEANRNTIINSVGQKVDSYFNFNVSKDGRTLATLDDAVYLYNRDYYAYVYNCTKTSGYNKLCKVTTDTPIKVEKEDIPSLTERYKVFFFGKDDITEKPHASIFPLYPSYYSEKDTTIMINAKVGIIEDNSVIKAMARNESGAKEKLYNYAKNATNGLTYKANLSDAHDIDISNLTVQNGKYYYIYLDIEDPENKYIDVSDATLVMGESGMLVNEVKYGEYSDIEYEYKDYEYACYSCTNEYVWTAKGYQAKTCTLVDSITEKSKCVKNVKTGVEDYLLPGIIILTIGSGIVIFLNKKTRFKRI